MSEPTIPPPTEEDLAIDLQWVYDTAETGVGEYDPAELKQITRRCHAAETQRDYLKAIVDRHDMMQSSNLYETQKRYCKQLETQLAELLAVIFRDGGQRAGELGDKAIGEAKRVWVDLITRSEERDELLAALRQIANDGGEFCMPSRERRESSIDYHRRGDNMRDLARRVIASIEREKGGQ